MGGQQGSYEEFAHEHELLPKWARFVGNTLGRRPTDSTLKTVARFGALLTSPIWAAAPTLAAHAYDEIVFQPVSATVALPGIAAYKVSKALERMNPTSRPWLYTPTTAPRPTPPKIAPPKPIAMPVPIQPTINVRIPPIRRASSPAPPPRIPTRSFVNNLSVAPPSWKLTLDKTLAPKPTWGTIPARLTPVEIGTSNPYRPYTSNLGLGTPKLTLKPF